MKIKGPKKYSIMLLLLILSLFLQTVCLFNIRCSYFTINWPAIDAVYGCSIQNNLTTSSRELSIVESVSGSHTNGQKDETVTALYLKSKGINFFPYGLHNIFENIKAFSIQEDNLKEIHQFDLKFLPKLELVEILRNEIEVLENHLFAYNPNLKYVNFQGNKIIQIGLQALTNLENLRYLKLSLNPCIELDALDNATAVIQVINNAKTNCLNPDFSTLQDELTKLEDSMICASSETSLIMDINLHNFEVQLNNSKYVQPASLRSRFIAFSNLRKQQTWNVKKGLENIEKLTQSSNADTLNWINRMQTNIIKSSNNNKGMTSASLIESSFMNLSSIATKNLDLTNKNLKKFADEFTQFMDEYQRSQSNEQSILNNNIVMLEKLINTTIKSQGSQSYVSSDLKSILNSIQKAQTDLADKVTKLNESVTDLSTAMMMKSGNSQNLLSVVKDDIVRSLNDLKSSQVELNEKVLKFKNAPKSAADQFCVTRAEKLEKLLIASNNNEMPDKIKIILMSIYGLFQTVVLVIIYREFYHEN